ncbi:MAG: restriction endonuclease, partial [Chlorobiota bacterium]
MSKTFFPQRPEANPTIYAYEDSNPAYKGLLKVGFTNLDAQTRVAQQYPVLRPGEPPYRIVLEEPAMRNDGTVFSDHDVHRFLRKKGLRNPNGEWFECTVEDVKSAILTIKSGVWFEENRTLDFPMRPEQQAAVEKTIAYFRSFKEENPGKTPHFLWNAKMRFGKTFAAYQLAKAMGWRKILVLTFKPAVQSAWEEDLMTHVDFSGWQFLSRNGSSMEVADTSRPLVCFGSFQDFLGKNEAGGIKARNEWVHTTNWDCVILDEYHYGAWRENAKDLFDAEEKREVQFAAGAGLEWFDEEIMPITTDHYLYLSGTPFRAIASGEFIEEQIYNWTYSDEQRAKAEWKGEPNPYAALPRMVLLTYQLPPSIQDVIKGGEFDEFDLNEFFKAEGEGGQAIFRHMNEVQKWLDLIRGSYLATTVDNLKLGAQKPPMPFSDVRLLGVLNHTFWFLPSVAACHAMANLLGQPQNRFYHEYRIVVAAGSAAGIGVDALPPVLDTMENPLKTKSITLSCGKLTTGVSVKPWTGIFMLRNSSSPETYFQAAFRVQTPWTIKNPDNLSPNKEVILKNECYIFDFAPDRALRQIADYSCRLNVNEDNPEKKVAEFIKENGLSFPIGQEDGEYAKAFGVSGIPAAAIVVDGAVV